MTENPEPEDIHTRIQNTIAILHAELQTLDAHARQDLRLALETLVTAETALQTIESELDLVTAPDLSAAEEAQRLRQRLDEAELRVAGLEQQLVEAREKLQLEDQIHQSEHDRLRELEQRAKKMETLLETDADAFGTFMDNALDRDGRPRDRG